MVNRPACCVLHVKTDQIPYKEQVLQVCSAVGPMLLQQFMLCCSATCAASLQLSPFQRHAVLLQEEAKSLKYPLARDYLNYVKWRITVHFKKLDNPKVAFRA
jgi:hypothetical protein